jgi:rhodanese-related sulfurtransferase
MIWSFVILVAVVAGWYLFEGHWDRRLFHAEPGRACVNLKAGEAQAWLRAHPETQVLDVRSTGEFAGGALPKAVNVSLGDPAFEGKVAALDRSRPVLVYCAGGYRSRKAVVKLKQLGFANIQHLHRGYLSWSATTGQ